MPTKSESSESIAKELITLLASKDVSFKEADEILSMVNNHICSFKYEPIKGREEEPLSGILEWLT